MTKILYILGCGSCNGNQELRWSLRSLEQNALDDVEPCIVGAPPDWFRGEALACNDPFSRKEKNMAHALDVAIGEKLVAGEFQISADDHFWMKPTEFAKLPFYFRQGAIPDERDGNNHVKALAGTRRALLKAGYPILNTAVHCNTWVNTADLPRVWAIRNMLDDPDLADAKEYGLVSWALWPNLAIGSGREPRRPIVFKHDVKVRNWDREELDKVSSAPVWSCNDDAFLSKPFVAIMEERFGKKCRWEK